MGSNRREFLKFAGTEIAAGAAGTMLKGRVAEAGDKLPMVVEKQGELKFALV